MAGMKVACLVLVMCIVVAIAPTAKADRFDFIIYTLTPCYSFLLGSTSTPGPYCCIEVKKVVDDATTFDDRQETCICLRDMALSLKNLNVENGAALFSLCGIQTPYQITTDLDCTKIKVEEVVSDAGSGNILTTI